MMPTTITTSTSDLYEPAVPFLLDLEPSPPALLPFPAPGVIDFPGKTTIAVSDDRSGGEPVDGDSDGEEEEEEEEESGDVS